LRDPIPQAKLRQMHGFTFTKVERRAKYLLFTLQKSGKELGFLSHLGMTGTWRVETNTKNLQEHDHVLIHLSDGRVLVYRDPRRFGILDTWSPQVTSHPRLDHLGLEPLSNDWTGEHLWKMSRGRTQSVKAFLMDQKTVVGVGNIYAAEALFKAGIRPTRPARRLTLAEAERLVDAAKTVLQQAIAAGGSTLQDFYSFGGAKGGFQDLHFVYDRAGLECRVCRGVIRQKVLGGRSSFWCARCQS
jgi:formamidopyrimidine-DNA glycosylase